MTDHLNSEKSYTRKYQYQGDEILAELDEDNTKLAVFTHSTLRTDDVLSVEIRSEKLGGPGSYTYLKDHLGSITDIVDETGSLIQHYTYSSFGKLLKITNSIGEDITTNPSIKTNYGYTNREHDEESGLMNST